MSGDDRLKRYAELAVRVGANVQPGQEVMVRCMIEHHELARAVVEAAYEAGARYVHILYWDPIQKLHRLNLAEADSLEYVPPVVGQGDERPGGERGRGDLDHRGPRSRPLRGHPRREDAARSHARYSLDAQDGARRARQLDDRWRADPRVGRATLRRTGYGPAVGSDGAGDPVG
ncbi:MAG: aminopeptidase [Actinobacteria bacterium]|nr:aminopeptidase [Actinomycetota bacterium]